MESVVIERSVPARVGIFLQYAAAMILWGSILVATGFVIVYATR